MKRSVTAEPDVNMVECGNCGAEAWGYTDKDLAAEGWTANSIRYGQTFRLCGECARVFERRRKEKQAATA